MSAAEEEARGIQLQQDSGKRTRTRLGRKEEGEQVRCAGSMRSDEVGSKIVVDVVHDDELEDVCDRERVCERKSDGPEFGLLVTSKSNQPKYYFLTHRPPNKDPVETLIITWSQ